MYIYILVDFKPLEYFNLLQSVCFITDEMFTANGLVSSTNYIYT